MPFVEITPIDQAINVIIVVIAPLLILFRQLILKEKILNKSIFPLIIIWAYIILRLLVSSSKYRATELSTIISIVLSIYLGSQVTILQLRQLRLLMYAVAVFFSFYALIYAQKDISNILSKTLKVRLGADYSSSILVAYPRMLYMLVLTCFVTAVVEEKIWLKIGALSVTIIPIMIALSTGGRGALVGLICAIFVFILGRRQPKFPLIGIVFAVLILFIIYNFVSEYLPLMNERIEDADDAGRSYIYLDAISNISLIGRGIGQNYAHNIFLEFLQDYGIVGLCLFLYVFTKAIISVSKLYSSSGNVELLWVISLFTLQLIAQQLSLNIFCDMFWASFVIPLCISDSE